MRGANEASDEFHFFALATAIGTAIGRRVYTYQGMNLYTNMYTALVGETTRVKKSTALRPLVDQIMGDLRVSVLSSVSSAEGLCQFLINADESKERRLLITLSELSTLLRKARQDSVSNIIPVLTDRYDMGPVFEVPTRASPLIITNPTISILAGTTGEWLEADMRVEDIEGGFIPRFMFIHGQRQTKIPLPVAPDIKEFSRHLTEAVTKARELKCYMTVKDGTATTEWEKFYMTWETRIDDPFLYTVLARLPSHVMKFATLYAALDEKREIEAEHMGAALCVGDFLIDSTREVFRSIEMSGAVRLEKKVIAMLHGGSPMLRSDLHRRLSGRIRADQLDGILRGLQASDRVKMGTDKEGKKWVTLQ